MLYMCDIGESLVISDIIIEQLCGSAGLPSLNLRGTINACVLELQFNKLSKVFNNKCVYPMCGYFLLVCW